MASPINIPTYIAQAKICQYYWANDLSKAKIFKGGTITPRYDRILYMVRKAVEWKYNNSIVTTIVTPETKASSTFFTFGLPLTVSGVIQVQVDDPVYGIVTLCSYTVVSGDTTIAILTGHIKTALTGNAYGLTITASANDRIIGVAPAGKGASMNGKHFIFNYTGGPDFTSFSGGVNAVTTTDIDPQYLATLIQTSDYLYSLMGKYQSVAAILYSGSGCVAPVITINPLTQTVGAGGNVTFVSGATGTNISYQWQKNDVNISGAILSTYTINGLVSGDAGNYRCVITNPCGSANTTEAALTVGAGDIIGYYYFGSTDYFAALNGGTDAVPYIDTFPIVDGQDLSVPVLDIYTDNLYNVIKYPSSQGVKTSYDNHTPNIGFIPGPNYQNVVTIGSWNYLISRVAMSLSSSFPILFKA